MTKFSIPDMSCGHCKATIETALIGLDGAATLDFDMPARQVSIHSAASEEAVRRVLKAVGYEATPV